MEIWKDVPGYVGLYQVSNYGNVKSILYNKILKSCWRNSKKEYKTVYLSNCKIGILNGKSKAVIRFSMNNKLIDEFESINIASNITGINKRGIALAANKKRKTAGGYIWKIK